MTGSPANLKVKVKFSIKDIISAVNELGPQEREIFVENLLASVSPEYQQSIKEARDDYRAGRVSTHEELFGKGASK